MTLAPMDVLLVSTGQMNVRLASPVGLQQIMELSQILQLDLSVLVISIAISSSILLVMVLVMHVILDATIVMNQILNTIVKPVIQDGQLLRMAPLQTQQLKIPAPVIHLMDSGSTQQLLMNVKHVTIPVENAMVVPALTALFVILPLKLLQEEESVFALQENIGTQPTMLAMLVILLVLSVPDQLPQNVLLAISQGISPVDHVLSAMTAAMAVKKLMTNVLPVKLVGLQELVLTLPILLLVLPALVLQVIENGSILLTLHAMIATNSV